MLARLREWFTRAMTGTSGARSRAMEITLHHGVETFIGTLVLDGVLERHPELRGGVIELGAGWVPSMLKRLDWIAEIWRKSEPDLAALTRKPSRADHRADGVHALSV